VLSAEGLQYLLEAVYNRYLIFRISLSSLGPLSRGEEGTEAQGKEVKPSPKNYAELAEVKGMKTSGDSWILLVKFAKPMKRIYRIGRSLRCLRLVMPQSTRF